ncbi:hypothetical protein [Novosphingobium sp. FKTRR1]|uniref:hypothetical protein n=1 Tax=Novosphingobium sp. FKTRR1 TaxID=2879118 RepID=UPI001CF009F7|nr:hypothetical protein [Novosphingobium sp. FKTRR1]
MIGIGAGIKQRMAQGEQQMGGAGGPQDPPEPANDNVTAQGDPDSDGDQRADNDSDGDGSQSQASPEEQAVYDKFVNNALEIIYPADQRGQMSKSVAAHLQGQYEPQMQDMLKAIDPPIDPHDPVDNIGATAALIGLFLDASANQAGKDIPDDVIFHAGREVVEVLGNDGEKFAGLHVDDKQLEQAFYRAGDIFRQISPRVDQQQLANEFGQIVQADKSGQLNNAMPGIKQGRAA